jgi:hypothetical protein
MAEQYSAFQDFDTRAAGQALGREARSTRDVAHGDGQAFDLTDAVLEVFPEAGVTRATTPDARIELFRVPRYEVREQHVVFEQGTEDARIRLIVSGDGKVSYRPVLRAAETPQTSGTATDRPKDSHTRQDPSETVTGGNTATPEPREAVPEVLLQGRLGRDPWFATRDDRPASGFPLAVNPKGGGQATWHNIVTFDEVAEELRRAYEERQINSGKLVEATGHPVVIEQPGKNGRTRKFREFHASSVARVDAPKHR